MICSLNIGCHNHAKGLKLRRPRPKAKAEQRKRVFVCFLLFVLLQVTTPSWLHRRVRHLHLNRYERIRNKALIIQLCHSHGVERWAIGCRPSEYIYIYIWIKYMTAKCWNNTLYLYIFPQLSRVVVGQWSIEVQRGSSEGLAWQYVSFCGSSMFSGNDSWHFWPTQGQ